MVTRARLRPRLFHCTAAGAAFDTFTGVQVFLDRGAGFGMIRVAMAPKDGLRFVPAGVEGLPNVTEVVVFPDRLELLSGGEWVVVRLLDIARWIRRGWLYRPLARLGFGVWVVSPDGGNLRNIAPRGLGAAWSRDSQWLLTPVLSPSLRFRRLARKHRALRRSRDGGSPVSLLRHA